MTVEEILGDLTGYAHKVAKDTKHDFRFMGYEAAVEHAEDMAVMVYGEPPEKIINKARPNESPIIKQYRIESYEPEVLGHYRRITNVVSTIFNPAGYSVKWPESPARIDRGKDAETFFSSEYGVFKSLMNYVSGCGVDATFADPDAVIFIDPRYKRNEYPEPVPVIVPSKNVVDYVPARLVMVESEEKSEVKTAAGRKEHTGKIYLVFTPLVNYEVVQVGKKSDFRFEVRNEDAHGMGEMTARMLGGIVECRGMAWHYRSFVSGVLPSWNMAIRRASDFEGMMINHMVSQRVRINMACRDCRGKKTTRNAEGEVVNCGTCRGSGVQIATGPYEDVTIDPNSELQLKPADIIHYAQQPIDQADFIREDIERKWQDGFAAVVMDVVNAVGTNQSGKAKDIDLTHLRQWLAMLANHFYDLAEWILSISIRYRYGGILGNSDGPNYEAALELMPDVSRPHKFDSPTATKFLEELKALGDSNVHASVSRERQKDVIVQLYGQGSKQTKRLIAELELDPYAGINPDDKLAIGSRGNLDRVDGYISDNLNRLLIRAESENADFYDLERAEQMQVLRDLAAGLLEPAPEA